METAPHPWPNLAETLAAAQSALEADEAAAELRDRATEAAGLVAALTQDADLAVATALDSARARTRGRARGTRAALPGAAARLAERLERLGDLQLPAGWSTTQSLGAAQSEVLRKMLLAMAADPRLLVARIAERLVQLRHARTLPAAEQQHLALEAREIYAPLANRLGIWQVKWELEDLAFRYLEPQSYRHIAGALAERRIDREHYIEQVCAQLRQELQRAGVEAAVYGRPKHIYSIARKMQRKHVAFEQLFDVRAVRIVVATVADCYAALGVVHGLWPYIPGEFDDYIATPKDNEYRSIHTAVIGPEHKSVEVQIRTRDMHEHAELGVAAHWRYKEGGGRDEAYERQIRWARQVLEPAAAQGLEGDLIERTKGTLFADRIYAMTPRGAVLDLPRGATPLDFAYHVHTGLGHRCRGAKVNGRIVPLLHSLASGDVVEIITGKQAAPSRDWLLPEPRYLVSARARAKVRAWFRHQESGQEANRPAPAPEPTPEPAPLASPPRRVRAAPGRSPVQVDGVGDLPITLARCCAPMPPEPIAGYITLGRGVTIHRARCANLLRMEGLRPERVLAVDWNLGAENQLPVQIQVEALDRRGLLRDVSDVLALEKLSIEGVNSDTDPRDRIATIVMRTAVHDIEQLGRVLRRLGQVPNVLRARRLT